MPTVKIKIGSLQIKILLVVLIVVFFHTGLTAFLLADRLKNQITDTTRKSMLSSLYLTEERVSSELARRAETTNNLATQIYLLPNKNPAYIRSFMANYLTLLHRPPLDLMPSPQAAYCISPDSGQFICSGQSWTVSDLKKRPWWRQVLRGIEPNESLGNQFANSSILVKTSFVGDVRLTPGPATLPIYWVINENNEILVVGIDFSADLTETPTGPSFPTDDLYGELYDPHGVLLALPSSESRNIENYKLFSNNAKKKRILAKAIAEAPSTPSGSLIYTNSKGIKVLGMYIRGIMGFIYIKEKPLHEVYGPANRQIADIIWLSLAIAMVAALLLTLFLLRDVVHPVHQLCQAMDRLGAGELTTRIANQRQDEFGQLFKQFNSTAEHLQHLIRDAYVERLARRQAELEFLQAQINPHFLYNTLDCIYRLVLSGDSEEGSRAILSLSKLFRLSLGRGPSIVTIAEAFEQLKHYLELQHLRHGDRITVEINVPSDILGYKIPKLLLQPVVENTFVHGLEPKHGNGKLVITGAYEDKSIYFTITDNGVGMSDEQLLKAQEALANQTVQNAHGLANVHRRLILAYGEAWGVNISHNPGGGLRVDIRWPALI
jgi:signal transduction histidine kinase